MRRIIKLENLDKDSIVIEESQKFKDSMFELVYQKTGMLLANIINKSNTEKKQRENERKRDSYRAFYMENMISFDGRRGTGKTSAMLSVHQALRECHGQGREFLENSEIENTSFVVLDYIDASTLEKGEDILNIILANMFYQMRKCGEYDSQNPWNYEERQLCKKFDQIYADYKNINSTETTTEEISPLKELMQLSNSQMLRNKIAEFVDEYLNYMTNIDKRSKSFENKFLVIAIDDLDMGFPRKDSTSFELLETLHRYFMIPGVVIMLTYNYEDLLYGCEGHFCKIFHERNRDLDALKQDYIEDLTNQYLKKVLPIYSRVYMPSMKKRDYGLGTWIEIQSSIEEKEDVLKEFRNTLTSQNYSKSIILPVKKFVMQMRASVAGLYYDSQGEKGHFVEPTTLRELSHMYVFYKQIAKKKQKEKSEAVVVKELLDDLYFHTAKTSLGMEEDKIFSKYLSVKIERRSKDILSDIREYYKANNKEPFPVFRSSDKRLDDISLITYCGDAEMSYSYGELLYGLFQARQEGWFSRGLICCILDSYTIMLSNLYHEWKQHGDNTCRDRFLETLGASVSSSWSCKFVPKVQKIKMVEQVKDDEGKKEKNIFDVFSEATTYEVLPENSDISTIAAVKFGTCRIQWDFELEDSDTKEMVKAQFQMLEILFMFFTDAYYRDESGVRVQGFVITYEPKGNRGNEVSAEEGESPKAAIRIKFSDGCFNIMNFVNNSLNSDEFFTRLHVQMFNAVKVWFNNKPELFGNEPTLSDEKIRSIMNQNSLSSQYEKWAKKTKGFAMPLYSFDMMYNLFKRQYKYYGKTQNYVPVEKFLSTIRNLYRTLGELLKQQDEFYFSDEDWCIKEEDCRFYNAYRTTPFLQEMENIMSNRETKIVFENRFSYLTGLIAALVEQNKR